MAEEVTNPQEEFVKGALSTLYNLDTVEIDSLLEESGDDPMKALIKAQENKLKTAKDSASKARDEQYSKGKREQAEKSEKALRAQFGIEDSTLKGEDLTSAIQAKLDAAKDTSKKPDKVDDTELMTKYKELQKEHSTYKETSEATKNDEINLILNQHKSEQLQGTVSSAAMGALQSDLINYAEGRASLQQGYVVRELLEGNKFGVDESGAIQVLAEDGSLKQNDLGITVTFTDLVDGLIKKHIGLKKAKDRTSTGDDKTKIGVTDTGAWDGKMPASQEEAYSIWEGLKGQEQKDMWSKWSDHKRTHGIASKG